MSETYKALGPHDPVAPDPYGPMDDAVTPEDIKALDEQGEQLPELNGHAQRFMDACELIAQGSAVKQACETAGIDRVTFYRSKERDESARNMYERAREGQGDAHADRIIEVAEACLEGRPLVDPGDGSIRYMDPQAARVAIDAYKWTASKLRPQAYGERLEHRLSADDSFLQALDIIEQRRGKGAKVIEHTTELDDEAG